MSEKHIEQFKWKEVEDSVLRLGGEAPIKLQAMINYDTEVSAFGICKDDPLNVVDLLIPRQTCSCAMTRMDDDDLAEEVTRLAKEGTPPLMTSRIWIHTHPGGGIPSPSGQDWTCFSNLIECGGWAVMLIFAHGGGHYCRLGYKIGDEKYMIEIPVRMDLSYYGHPETKEEIKRKVKEQKWTPPIFKRHHWTDDMYDMGLSHRHD